MTFYKDFNNNNNDNDDDKALLSQWRVINIDDLELDSDKKLYQKSLDVPYDSGAPVRHVRTRMHKIPKRSSDYVSTNQPLVDTSLMALSDPSFFEAQSTHKYMEAASNAPEFNKEAEEVSAVATNADTDITSSNETSIAIDTDSVVAAIPKSSDAKADTKVSIESSTSFSVEDKCGIEDSVPKADGDGENENEEKELVIKLSPIAIDHDLIDEDGDVIDVPFLDLLALVGQFMQAEGQDSLIEANSSATSKRSSVDNSNVTKPISLTPLVDSKECTNVILTNKGKSDIEEKGSLGDFGLSIQAQAKTPQDSALAEIKSELFAVSKMSADDNKPQNKAKSQVRSSTRSKIKSK